jgi:hypothetical protein
MELNEQSERERRRQLAKLPYRNKLLAVRSLLEIKLKMRHARKLRPFRTAG